MIKHGIWFTLLTLLFTGCSSIGPPSVHHDRFDHNKALSDSWKEQTLLNIVRLRYADMPIFLEVTSIDSGYTLEGSVNLTVDAINGLRGRKVASRKPKLGDQQFYRLNHLITKVQDSEGLPLVTIPAG